MLWMNNANVLLEDLETCLIAERSFCVLLVAIEFAHCPKLSPQCLNFYSNLSSFNLGHSLRFVIFGMCTRMFNFNEIFYGTHKYLLCGSFSIHSIISTGESAECSLSVYVSACEARFPFVSVEFLGLKSQRHMRALWNSSAEERSGKSCSTPSRQRSWM